MKNFINEDGQVNEAFVGALIESADEAVTETKAGEVPEYFYENEDYLFGLSNEVIEAEDGKMYARIFELEQNIFESLDQEKVEPVKTVEIDEVVYNLSDEISLEESTGEVYVLLVEAEEEEEDEDENIVTIDGVDYEIVENEEDADAQIFVNDDGEIVDDEDEAEGVVFLKER